MTEITGPSSDARAALLAAWGQLLSDLGSPSTAATALGAELVERWSEPHRRYHGPRHLSAVLDTLDDLAAPSAPSAAARLAAWFHDAVYAGRAGDDEERSAKLAADRLTQLGLDRSIVDQVAAMVRATAGHIDPTDPDAGTDADTALLLDADLAILGAPSQDYERYVDGIRAEHPQLDEAAWRAGRGAVLATLLDRPVLFRTATGRDRYERAARANLRRELATLNDGRG